LHMPACWHLDTSLPSQTNPISRAPIESIRRFRIEPSLRFDSYEYSLYSTNIRSSTNPHDLLI
jgi:hypothetical protein